MPAFSWSYLNRGNIYFVKMQAQLATADFDTAFKLRSKMDALTSHEVYAALREHILMQRAGSKSELEQRVLGWDLGKWPGPLINLYLGKITPGQALATAKESSWRERKRQKCAANLYVGLHYLNQGADNEARSLLEIAANNCHKKSFEYAIAQSELQLHTEK